MVNASASGRFNKAGLCGMLAVLLTVAPDRAVAHTGAIGFSKPLSGIVVDGDLSDWPEDFVRYPVNTAANWDEAPKDAADHEAWFRIGHSLEENAVYVAIEVRDQSIVIDSTDTWNSQDGCEVYIEVSHGDQPNTQVSVRGVNVPDLEEGTQHREVAWSRHEDGHVYEWKLDVTSWSSGEARLEPGLALGMDVVITDRDADGSFSWMGWGRITGQKYGGTSQPLGDALILPADARLSQVKGSAQWKNADEDTQPRGVKLESRDFPMLVLDLATDDEGKYETKVPPGNYSLSVVDARLGERSERVDIRVRALHSNLAPIRIEPIRREQRLAELQNRLAAVEDWPHYRVGKTGVEAPAPEPAPWPAGLAGHIAYLADRDFNEGEHQEVWVMDLATGQTVKLTHNHGGHLEEGANTSILLRDGKRMELPVRMAGRPGWSADGRRIAFASAGEGGDISVVDADWQNPQRLTNTEAAESHPVWSPDGKRLAYLVRTGEDLHLHVMEEDGSQSKQVTDLPVSNAPASWSPDGTRLVFGSSSSGNPEIYTAAAAVGDVVNLTNSESAETAPRWSPDSSTILYESNRYAPPQVWVMNSDGTNAYNLTNAHAFSGRGSWSPDGSRIVFESERELQRELFLMNADGSAQVQLTRDPHIYREGWDVQWIPASSATLSLLPTAAGQLERGEAGGGETFRRGSPSSPWFSFMHIANLSKASLAIYRLDYNGNESRYHTLAPGESVEQQSTRHHLWRLKKVSDGALLGELVADRKRMVILVE